MSSAARPDALGLADTPFRYLGYEVLDQGMRLDCHYGLGDLTFTERIEFPPSGRPGGRADPDQVDAAARLVHLLAGVSYFKALAPGVIDLGTCATTRAERAFLRDFYVDGLGEMAYRNGLDLSAIQVVGPDMPEPVPGIPFDDTAGDHPAPLPRRPLIPFGGGIDSIVTAELVKGAPAGQVGAGQVRVGERPEPALFVLNPGGTRFDAIEGPAGVTGLPIVRAQRHLDPKILRSEELGFLNGHVPVTGILSAIAVLAAVLDGRDAVVMSNEWSSSIANLEHQGRPVNHQYSKSMQFEAAFRAMLASSFGRLGAPGPQYFSMLRGRSELWVARQFARLPRYHQAFHSCNRGFHVDPAHRLDRWCGRCDKCCFIDLVLAPFVAPEDLDRIFSGREPLRNPDLADRFRTLIDITGQAKPFECVGDPSECRAALQLAAGRSDRAGDVMVQDLQREVSGRPQPPDRPADALFQPMGPDFVPDGFATDHLVG